MKVADRKIFAKNFKTCSSPSVTPWFLVWLALWPHESAKCEKSCREHGYFLHMFEVAGMCYCEPFTIDHENPPYEATFSSDSDYGGI
jgi:hypothetical protein